MRTAHTIINNRLSFNGDRFVVLTMDDLESIRSTGLPQRCRNDAGDEAVKIIKSCCAKAQFNGFYLYVVDLGALWCQLNPAPKAA